jgi:hypothetical protein
MPVGRSTSELHSTACPSHLPSKQFGMLIGLCCRQLWKRRGTVSIFFIMSNRSVGYASLVIIVLVHELLKQREKEEERCERIRPVGF